MNATVAPPNEPSALLAGYQPVGAAFDELFTDAGQVRARYGPLMRDLDKLGPAELKRRADTVRRLIHEQGITYNIYGDARGLDRPWQIDLVPFVIAADEWKVLEAALVQRATLINRILADCYGAQELIRSGGLPPALVFAQPDFLRPCHGIRAPQDIFLHFYAADLARSPDGRWWVTSDRTQIATGAGYALANRLITSRILPESFREEKVQRLAGFFRELRTSLARLALRRTDNPRVVLLTPGPYNETYFEQAWLARYLGYMLVEGQDLTVRDNRVFLKTLSGLEPVDVVLRRVDDDFCDPLELRNDSMLGVPGLLEALRAGNVAVANPPGSGLLQNPAFLAFLPDLCRRLLGEELKLPSIATWWCGQESAREYVLEHLDELYVKPAFRRARARGTDPGGTLSEAGREELKGAIEFQPHFFVGQEWQELSSAPSWSEHGLASRPTALRAFLVAVEGGYTVMPGGLTRVATGSSGRSVSMQRGGASKDTWVLSDRPVDEITLLHLANQNIELRRVGNNLPSRMADNFFWLGRYAERADGTARLLRSALLRISPEGSGSTMPVLAPILTALEAQRQIASARERPELRQNVEALEAELLAAVFDPARPNSLRNLTDQLEGLAMVLRHRTSNDLWRTLSHLDDRLRQPVSNGPPLAGDALGVINQALLGLAAFQGLARENMTRAQGWRFLDMGYRIERALCVSTFLDAALHSTEADNPSVLEAVLGVCDSSITYRSRYNLLPHIAAVYDLLLLDDTNPRSILFQLNQLVKHFDRLPRERESALPGPSQRILIECLARLRLTDPHTLAREKANWHETETAQVVRFIARQMPRLSDAISVSYFAHSAISRTGRGGEK